MSVVFTIDEKIRLLAQQYGVSPARAAGLLREQGGVNEPATVEQDARGIVALPFRMTIPWSELCSDNEKEVGALIMRSGKPIPRKVLTARYKASKEAIRNRAKAITECAQPRTEPLAIRVQVWLPPSRRNDAINFAKVLGDSLEGVIFENDNQLHRSLWQRMGTDIDAPRAEVEISAV